mgnify:FL=1
MTNLANISEGDTCQIKWIMLDGYAASAVAHLGIKVGSVIKILVNAFGDLVILINNKRIAINRSIAEKIRVSIV